MAIANLHETIQASILRRNALNLQITEWQAQKNLAVASMADVQALEYDEKAARRDYFKDLYENDETLQAKYSDYTEIPDFEEEMDKLAAKYQEELDQLTAWETEIDRQMTTASAELKEIEAYLESYKEMLSSNIKDDFNFGLK